MLQGNYMENHIAYHPSGLFVLSNSHSFNGMEKKQMKQIGVSLPT